VGLTHVRAKNYLASLLKKVLDRRKSLYDSLIGGDNTVLQGYVKIATDKDSLAGYVDILNGFLVVSHLHIHLSIILPPYNIPQNPPNIK
jgi:hypothetical protein